MYLYELQSAEIDRELANTADAVKNSGEEPMMDMEGLDGMDDDGMGGMDDDFGEMSPDGMEGEGEDEADPIQAKDIDSEVVSSVHGMSYLDDYRHEDNSKIHPMRILQMEMNELEDLHKLVKAKIINTTIMSEPGSSYADPGAKFFTDLLSFVDKVIDGAKKVVQDSEEDSKSDADKVSNPKPKMQNAPKNNETKEFKHNPNKQQKESRRFHRNIIS